MIIFQAICCLDQLQATINLWSCCLQPGIGGLKNFATHMRQFIAYNRCRQRIAWKLPGVWNPPKYHICNGLAGSTKIVKTSLRGERAIRQTVKPSNRQTVTAYKVKYIIYGVLCTVDGPGTQSIDKVYRMLYLIQWPNKGQLRYNGQASRSQFAYKRPPL